MTKEQFGNLILNNKESLYRAAYSILRNEDDCAEAIQEAIVKAFEKLNFLKKDEYAKTWLIRIVINESYAICRHRKRFADEEPSPVKADANYTDLYSALEMLNEKQRLSINLFYLEGYSIKEIAGILKTTEASVKMNLKRAKKKLREYLED